MSARSKTQEVSFCVKCPNCNNYIAGTVALSVVHYWQSGGGPVTSVAAVGREKGSRLVAFHYCA